MRIILSPAKKMRVNRDYFPCRNLPYFIADTEKLLTKLRAMSYEDLKKLWKCNDTIASVNYDRVQHMNLYEGLSPAVLSYQGLAYQYMAPDVFTDAAYEYIEEHLRILSGFYGLLRPFDGVKPYRLEMQARFGQPDLDSLYDFWGGRLAALIFSETDCVLNLASKEYSKCIEKYKPQGKQIVTCVFGQMIDGKVKEKATPCKMARGEMVRYMAELGIEDVQQVKQFDRLGYRFRDELSAEDKYVFVQEDLQKQLQKEGE